MSDIFISYKSSDRERVRVLVEALEGRGWSVWWDREIPPGKTFDQVIEEELNAARCVIVVWSKDSVLSEWVKTEASEAARRGIFVPVLIDDVKIPLEFRRIQAAWLVDWQGKLPHPGFEQLSEAVAGILGPSTILKEEQD
ncbi:MAG: toll/interleukin-1 receptor domain-containing protein, partial [Thermodesulfobacteriota bacterium]